MLEEDLWCIKYTGEKMSKSYLTPNQVAELLMVTPTAVRQWAEKGDLKALVTPGGHRRFLPADVEHFASERGVYLSLGRSEQLRVLIVDDNEQLTRYLVKLLEEFPEQIVTEVANDGFAAGLKVREFEPDVILLDLMMPGMNGFQVCRLLKAGATTKAIRLIAMTGYPSDENIKLILSVGAEVCLAKPIDEQVLLKHLGLGEFIQKNKQA